MGEDVNFTFDMERLRFAEKEIKEILLNYNANPKKGGCSS